MAYWCDDERLNREQARLDADQARASAAPVIKSGDILRATRNIDTERGPILKDEEVVVAEVSLARHFVRLVGHQAYVRAAPFEKVDRAVGPRRPGRPRLR